MPINNATVRYSFLKSSWLRAVIPIYAPPAKAERRVNRRIKKKDVALTDREKKLNLEQLQRVIY